MAVRHTRHPVTGLQFHPESVLTEYGYVLVDRFLHGVAGRVEDLPSRADGVGGAGAAPPEIPNPAPPPPPPALVRGSSSPCSPRWALAGRSISPPQVSRVG